MKIRPHISLVLAFVLPFAPLATGQAHLQKGTATFEELSKAADQARSQDADDQAIELYNRALAMKPQWQEGLWYTGTLLYQHDKYSNARDTLRRFVALQSNAGPGWALLGLSEFKTREYPRAFDHFQRAMALGMGDRKDLIQSVFYFVAVLLTRAERYDESLNFIFKMIGAGHDKESLIEPLGLAALRTPLLPTEIPIERRELVRMAGEAAFASQTPDHESADKLFKQMESAYPNEPGVHFLYGVFLMDFRPEDGERELKRELEISPSNVPARIRLAGAYLQDQKLDEALPLVRDAVKLDPNYGPSHMMMGEVQVARGELAEGIKELEIARDKQPLTSRIHWDLLRAYTSAARPEDAKREKAEIEKLTRAAAAESGAGQDKPSE